MGPATVSPDHKVVIRQEGLTKVLGSLREKKSEKEGIHLIKFLPAGRGFENDQHWDCMTQQLSC